MGRMLADMMDEHTSLMHNGRGSEPEQGWPKCRRVLAEYTHLSFPPPPNGTRHQ